MLLVFIRKQHNSFQPSIKRNTTQRKSGHTISVQPLSCKVKPLFSKNRVRIVQTLILVTQNPCKYWVLENLVEAAGSDHTMALKIDRSLWAWGRNIFWQLGAGLGDARTPRQVGNETNWVSVSAGREHTMALKTDGSLWACA